MNRQSLEIMAGEHGWSKEQLFQLIENVRDYAIFVADTEGTIVTWNPGAENLFGFTADEAIGQSARMLFTPEDRANRIPEKEMEVAERDGCAEDERWHIRKDGTRFFASGVQTPLRDESGELTGFAKIARDLTERIEAQESLQKAYESVEHEVQQRTRELKESNEALRSEVEEHETTERLRTALLRQIVTAQEGERKRIAREIHDNIGQQMTGLKLRIQHLLERWKDDPDILAEALEIRSLADRIDSEIDFLAWELRPAILDKFGLSAAVRKFVSEWSEHFSISAECKVVGLDSRSLPPEVEINIYRVVQEALNNIQKHANARSTSVVLEDRADELTLVIEDDGEGFRSDEEAAFFEGEGGMGLLGMKERAELIGGTFQVETEPGGGTTIFVRVPYRSSNSERA